MATEVCHHDDLVLEPISFADIKCNLDRTNGTASPPPLEDINGDKYFSVAMGVAGASKRKREASCSSLVQPKHIQHWRHALMKARSLSDPWEKFHLEDYPTEKALRHRYNALKKEWIVDEVVVKMEPKSFARGSMRECFRIKKLSNFSHNQDWRRDRNNAVAKRYISEVDRGNYFAEVKLQLDAKLWAEEYNRHHPPKQIDICMMGVLEFIDRPDKPLYHVENFIEGQYIKHNSNGGFVEDEAHRQTPQAFSHFTFERSGHELIVVDVQGVGDLYTDPQIHTVQGTEYGDGNLGTRGMALFFHTHVCNSICYNLGLTPFDLAPSEVSALSTNQRQTTSVSTVSRGHEEICHSPTDYQRTHLHEFLRMRTSSSVGSCSSLCESVEEWTAADVEDDGDNTNESGDHAAGSFRSRLSSESEGGRASPLIGHNGHIHVLNSDSMTRPQRRPRFISESGSASITDEADRIAFRELAERRARPSGLQAEVEARKKLREEGDCMDSKHRTGGSVLGQIHLDLAKYHEVQRFSQPGVDGYDKEAALYHLRAAADCDNLEAIITMARVALDLPHDVLPDLNSSHLEGVENRTKVGLHYMHLAAFAGDRGAMVYLAKAYDVGGNEFLGDETHACDDQRWSRAIDWYSRAVAMVTSDEEGNYDGTMDDPPYLLIARQAEMYQEGGHGLEQDYGRAGELYSEAADLAMAAMKGRLANKFYALAEEMNSLVDE